MIVKDRNDNDILTIPLDLAGCRVHFKHRLPTADDMSSLKQYCLTHGDTPWNPSLFSDQMADKFYQQVIDTESYSTYLDPTARSQTLSFYDPSDSLKTNIKGKPAYLIFHADTVQKSNVDSGEDIPKGYQEIPYHIVFDVKYDLRHKARLVAGGNKEDIYSGVAHMDTVRIGFFLGELYGLFCFACVIRNAFCTEKPRRRSTLLQVQSLKQHNAKRI
jgi:hypothetical protein